MSNSTVGALLGIIPEMCKGGSAMSILIAFAGFEKADGDPTFLVPLAIVLFACGAGLTFKASAADFWDYISGYAAGLSAIFTLLAFISDNLSLWISIPMAVGFLGVGIYLVKVIKPQKLRSKN